MKLIPKFLKAPGKIGYIKTRDINGNWIYVDPKTMKPAGTAAPAIGSILSNTPIRLQSVLSQRTQETRRNEQRKVELSKRANDGDRNALAELSMITTPNQGLISQGDGSGLYQGETTASERALNYWHPILGARLRWSSSWNNDTNPVKALYNSGFGYSLAPLRFMHGAEHGFGYSNYKDALKSLSNSDGLGFFSNLAQGVGNTFLGAEGAGNTFIETFPRTMVGKRSIETAMRTTSALNPLPEMKTGFKEMSNDRRNAIFKYILTGKPTEGLVYDSWNTSKWGQPGNRYTGLIDGRAPFRPMEGYGDFIDAYLYDKPLDPRIATRVKGDPLGVHSDYVAKNYAGKNIKVYETSPRDEDYLASDNDVLKAIKDKNAKVDYKVEGVDSSMPIKGDKGIDYGEADSQGHARQVYNVKNGNTEVEYARDQDIWKFNPNDYPEKYFKSEAPLKRFLLKQGVRMVNNAGTPVIVRSPWRWTDINELKASMNWNW